MKFLSANLSLVFATFLASAAVAADKAPAPKPAPSIPEQIAQRFRETVEARFDVPYAGNTNPRQRVDLFLPKKRASDKPLPVAVFIHGGGWSGGVRAGYASAAAQLASTGQYAAVSVGYRLSGDANGKWPAQIHDCKAAIRWIRGHAKEFNFDPEKISAQGSSAGGHLVAMLGVTGGLKELEGDVGEFTKESSRVMCVVNFCGPTDLMMPLFTPPRENEPDSAVMGLIGGTLKDKADVAKAASSVNYVTKDAVPILTVHGTADPRVSFAHAEKLHATLKKAGATSLLIPIVGGGHGASGGADGAARVKKFLDMYSLGVKAEISEEPIYQGAPPPPKPAAK
jgi:acetyl esterase/lipase